MKFFIFFVFVMFNFQTAKAVECYDGYKVPCNEWKPDIENNCGTGCTYSYDLETETLTVKATGENATIKAGAFMPYTYQTDTSKKTFPSENGEITVKTVVIDGDFSVGSYAFLGLGANIVGKDGQIQLNRINRLVFKGNNISGDIILSGAINDMANLFDKATISTESNIYCLEKSAADCKDAIINSCLEEDCRTYVSSLLNQGNFVKDIPVYKTRYTIQEADELTSDDNENWIEWIFE